MKLMLLQGNMEKNPCGDVFILELTITCFALEEWLDTDN